MYNNAMLSKDSSRVQQYLSIRRKGESYGYELIRVRELSGGQIELTKGMLIPYCTGSSASECSSPSGAKRQENVGKSVTAFARKAGWL
jgi:hypothetical protein